MSARAAVVIGASAGAIEALFTILPELPSNYPRPIMIVVHVPPRRESLITQVIQARCRLTVREAQDKDEAEPGNVYFAPPDYHMLVETDGRLSLSLEAPVHYCRPSVDVLFESAADAYGPSLVGVVLTGANQDGATGLRAIVAAGGEALVQQPADAHAPAMPTAAIAACPTAMVLSLKEIADRLIEVGRS